MRGRGRKGPNPLSRSYESNGPDVKIRGNAQHIAEKYITLARDATASGDRVMAENYLQHAEHYGRIVAASQGTFQLQREETDFEGEYDEDGEDNVQENGAPNGHPYPVPERAQQDRQQPQPNQMRNDRDRGDYNNRDRDGQNNRDYQNNRDFNRDAQNNREQRFNRNDRNRDRDPNRDSQARDGQNRNRDNRAGNGDERRSWESRGDRQQNFQERGERQQPNGLGPQPTVNETSSDDFQPAAAPVRDNREPRFERREDFAPEPMTAAPTAAQESGFGQGEASPAVLAEPEGAIASSPDVAPPTGEGAARRRGRPRRVRLGENDAPQNEPAQEADPVVRAAPEEPVVQAAPAGTEELPAAKRPRGRPRKKKPEDEGGEGDSGHMPDFLLASNG